MRPLAGSRLADGEARLRSVAHGAAAAAGPGAHGAEVPFCSSVASKASEDGFREAQKPGAHWPGFLGELGPICIKKNTGFIEIPLASSETKPRRKGKFSS